MKKRYLIIIPVIIIISVFMYMNSFSESEIQAIEVHTVFMREKGDEMHNKYARRQLGTPKRPRVLDVMEYRCADFYGYDVNLLFVEIGYGFEVDSGGTRTITAVLDRDSGEIYDRTMYGADFGSYIPKENMTREMAIVYSTQHFYQYRSGRIKNMKSEDETIVNFSENRIEKINTAIKIQYNINKIINRS